MTINHVAVVLETALSPDLAALRARYGAERCEFFSHRHANELHVFGLSLDVDYPTDDYHLLLLRITVVSLHSESITGDVRWFRTRSDLGRADLEIVVREFSSQSIAEFRTAWPRLKAAFETAAERRAPSRSP